MQNLDQLRIHDLDQSEVIERLVNDHRQARGGWIVTANADIMRLCHEESALATLISDADLIVADGKPLIWASKILGVPLRDRVCGSDLVWSIASRAEAERLSIFLLGGGAPDTAARAAECLRSKHPDLEIAGVHFPPFGFEKDPAMMNTIRQHLRDARPDVVYVALGFPKAEILINELKAAHPTTWWIGVGISLSFIAGEVKRAPQWMQAIGLEWLHRLLQEPRRLFKRYLWHDIPFVGRMLFAAAIQRLRRGVQKT